MNAESADMKLWTMNPCAETDQWYVWDMYEPLPPQPVFIGTMEDASLVADGLNRRWAVDLTRRLQNDRYRNLDFDSRDPDPDVHRSDCHTWNK